MDNQHDPMNLRPTLPLFALLLAPTLFAQTEAITIREDAEVQDPNAPLNFVEEMPVYPGGQDAMFAYISKNLKYPQEAMDKGIQGTDHVSFVVEKDGSINAVKTLRGIGGGCDEESVRVLQGMPKWTPGKQQGKEVRVQCNLPIRFKLAAGME